MGGFCRFGKVLPLAWLRPVADTEAASRTREKKTLAQSNLHVYIRTEWRKLLDSMRMPCRPPFYPYKPLQFCKHSKSFQNPWNVSLFKNSAELSSPVSHCFDNLDRVRLMWSPGGAGGGGGGGRCEVRRFHPRLNILFCKAINGFRIECVLHRPWPWFFTVHVLYVSGFTHQLF